MKSGGGVLATATLQLLVGLCLLGLYEGYKKYYYNVFLVNEQFGVDASSASDAQAQIARATVSYEDPLDFRSPMGASYYLAILNNIFAVFGLAGIFNAQRELLVAFFAYNAANMVVSFTFFVDLVVDAGVVYAGEPSKLNSYEQATCTFIFFNIILSVTATVYAVRSMEEIRSKQREDFNRFSGGLGDAAEA